MSDRRVAFINCRTYTGGSSLLHMPFGWNLFLKLSNDFKVDLVLGSEPSSELESQLPAGASLRYVHKHLSRRFPIREVLLALSCVRLGYEAVFGMGQVGTSLGRFVASLNRCPFIALNDEFPSCFGKSRWTGWEAHAYRRADAIVTPDINRVAGLCSEIAGLEAKPFFELLNTPLDISNNLPKINWHERLRLPAESIPLICAGGIGEHNQIPELLSSVPYWPEKFVFIVRGHNPGYAKRYKETLKHLDLPSRIFWVLEPLSTEEFDSLFQYCAISLAMYRYEGPNMIQMGKASGKILRSIALGVPVITSAFPSLSYVEEHGVGKCVRHPADIPSAISMIFNDRQNMSRNCLEYAKKDLCYDNGWTLFANHLATLGLSANGNTGAQVAT